MEILNAKVWRGGGHGVYAARGVPRNPDPTVLALPGSTYTVVRQRGDRLDHARQAVQFSRVRPRETTFEAATV